MNRTKLYLSSAAVLIAAALVINGCKAPTVPYQLSQFASFRVMNFAWNCTAPMDCYWTIAGQPRPTQASVYDLTYGSASVYTNLLQTGKYSVVVTPHFIPTVTDDSTVLTLGPNQKTTLIITRPSPTGPFNSEVIQDGLSYTASQNMTYVRFINLQPNIGPLSVHVDDPVTGDLINPVADSFGMYSNYDSLMTAQDTSYEFVVTNQNNQIIARLGYQTFTAGNCYTLVYAGDPCNTLANNPADSTQNAVDTMRLRAFDDNSLGNDLTNPILAAFRFNIVNDIIPVNAKYPYDANNDSTVGFLINGQGFPEFGGLSLPPVPLYQGRGENWTSMPSDSVLEVNYQSAVIPNPMVVAGFATNPMGTNQVPLFTAGTGNNKMSEAALLNDTNYGKPFTFLFYDTVPKNPDSALASQLSSSSHYSLVPVVDASTPGAVIFEFVAGIVPYAPYTTPQENESLFWAQPQGSASIPAASNSGKGLASGKYSVLTVPISSPTATFTVSDSVGFEGGSKLNTVVAGNSRTFTVQAGGIYEVVSVGTKSDPQLLIMHVN